MTAEVIRLDLVRKEYEAARRCEAESAQWDAKTASTLQRFATTLRERAAARSGMHGGNGLQAVPEPWGWFD